MVSKTIIVQNETGLHLRPAGSLAKIAAGLSSAITIVKGEQIADVKSLLSIIAMQINVGEQIIVQCEGPNEAEDLEIIINTIESNLE